MDDGGRPVIHHKVWALRSNTELGRDCALRGSLAAGDTDPSLDSILAFVLRYDTICYWRYRAQLVYSFDLLWAKPYLLRGFNTAD